MRLRGAPVIIWGGKTTTAACVSEHSAPSPAGQGPRNMDALTPTSLVHYYDTRLREILCGLRGFEYRSTKHSRNVTCHACLGLLAKRATTAPSTSDASTDHVAL